MNNAPELMVELTIAHEKKLEDLDKALVPRLKDNFQLYQALYRAVYDLFVQKGILKGDPYKNERHLSDIHAPEDLPMTESEIDEQLPIKLSEFDNLLDFLNNYTQFKTSMLGLKKIKILSAILKYIDWGKMTVNSTKPITRGVAAIAEKIRLGTDAMASGSLQSSHNKLEQVVKNLMTDLKTLADFKREEYKLFIRQRIIQHNSAFQNALSKDDFVRLIKGQFARTMEGEAFFPEIIGELYDEVYAENQEKMSASLLERFHVEEQKKKAETPRRFNLREILLEGLRGLGTASRHLDEGIAKLKENVEVLHNRPRTFMERFREWMISLSQGNKQKEEIFEIEIVDINTTMKKLEKVEFNAFQLMVQKKARFLTSLLVKTSTNYSRIETLNDEQLFEMLEKHIIELKSIHERLDALDTYFKIEVPAAERTKMRGIKVEMGNLKNSIALVTQKLHEFVARKDEMDQLRKLGIAVE